MKLEQTMSQFLKAMHKGAKQANSGITSVTVRDSKTFGGDDFFIICASKGTDKYDLVKSFVETLDDDKEGE